VNPKTVATLEKGGFTRFFPIQYKTFDTIYDGKDIIGRARTGSGKTLSFALPVMERLIAMRKDGEIPSRAAPKKPFAVVLAPTRELARQVHDVFKMIGQPHGFESICIYGGTAYDPQERAFNSGVDVVVGAPGRILDHLDRKNLLLDNLRFFVLDEADEMLNMGFREDIEKVLKHVPTAAQRQTLLYSATIPSWVQSVAKVYLKPGYTTVDLVAGEKNLTAITVRHLAVQVPPSGRTHIIKDLIAIYGRKGNVIVFCDTKQEANEIGLSSDLAQDCQVLHGDIVQSQREITLDAFRQNKFRVLVATDVAARGLDIENIDLVIQLKPALESETYVHRSGRTGRAGKHGTSLTLYAQRQRDRLRFLERETGIKFERIPAPQPIDLYKAAAEDAALTATELADKYPDMMDAFLNSAEQLLLDVGDPKKAIAAALIAGSGFDKPLAERSLLGGAEKMKTVVIHNGGERIRFKPFALKLVAMALRQDMDSGGKNLGIGEIKLCKDGGVVCDVPDAVASQLVKLRPAPGQRSTFELATTLPDLEEEPEDNGYGRGGNGFGGGRGGFGGGRGGGFGRGGGGGFYRGGGGGGFGRGGGGGFGRGRGGGGGFRGRGGFSR
jgi:ATP-dependent RNA helicase DDX21